MYGDEVEVRIARDEARLQRLEMRPYLSPGDHGDGVE